MTTEARLGIGGNNPPSEIEALKAQLQENNDKALKRAEALIAAADRVEDEINDVETSNKITDLEKLISVCWTAIEKARETEKRPYLDKGNLVQAFFNDPLKGLEAAKKRVKKIQTAFLVKEEEKEAKRRRDLAAEELRKSNEAADAAAKLEADGKKSQSEAVMEKAISHEDDAAFFEEKATVRGATMAVSTGANTGARSSLTYTWTGEIENREALDLEALRPYLSNDVLQKAINQYVKLFQGTKPLKGAKIWEKPDARTR